MRIELDPDGLGTTETLPEQSGGARQAIQGVPKNEPSIRAITRSARGPARARSRPLLNLESSKSSEIWTIFAMVQCKGAFILTERTHTATQGRMAEAAWLPSSSNHPLYM